jgi:hypothetical protein
MAAAGLVLAWAVLVAPARVLALALPVNVAPVAFDDTYTVQTGVRTTFPAPGVLKNDLDLDLDPLQAELVDGSGSGSLDLASDGSFTYKSPGSFVGDWTFTYRAWDGTTWSNVATVTIHVAPKPAPTPTPIPTPTPPPTPTIRPSPTPTPRPSLPLPSIGPLPTIVDPFRTPTPAPSATPDPTAQPSPGPSASPARSAGPSDPAGAGTAAGGDRGDGGVGGAGPGGAAGDPAPFSVGPAAGSDDGPPIAVADLGALGLVGLDSIADWAVPSLVLGVPGILLIVAVGAQVLGGAVWIPVVRRWLGGLGVRRREPTTR